MKDRYEEVDEPTPLSRGANIYRDLKALFQSVLTKRRIPPHLAHKVQLKLEVDLDPSEIAGADPVAGAFAARKFAGELLSKLHLLAQDFRSGGAIFPQGKIHCFWCASFECAHAQPPDSRAVFKGYSPTGEPVWQELAVLALEEHHPDIDSLYMEKPVPITLIKPGYALTREQLPVYGKHSNLYRILGQLLVGYIPFLNGKQDRGRFALTIQAVEVHRGRLEHDLNVLGVLPDGRPIAPFLEEVADARLADAISSAQQKLAELNFLGRPKLEKIQRGDNGKATSPPQPPWHPTLRAREEKALRILTRLAQNLERIYRQSHRRTLHAQDRHRDRERPASTALRDALEATPEALFRDVHEATWVVVGPKNRVHVFNDKGQHITSVVYPGETIRKRTLNGKWKNAAREAVEEFRERLRRLAAAPQELRTASEG
ncbi:MAG: hypothetical protein HY717_14635 [Planctomycetes bacterium]|nr:hypothetical protein [Planctomycetota bacterium]